MKKFTYSIYLILFSMLTAYSQSTVFYEDFSTDANGPTQTGSITNWSILKGNIDVSDTYIVDPSYTGKGIDLAGLENGIIETKNTLTLPAGTYTISFLARDNTYGNSAMLVEIGTLFSQTFNATGKLLTYSATFTVPYSTSAKMKLTENGPSDNGGTFLGNLKLVRACDPATAFYEDFSTDANGPTQTGSITNWNILKGNIDVSNTYIVDPSYTGKGIDLAGLENGTIETKNSINLHAGTYTLSFLARDNNYGNSAMLLEIGTLFSQTFNATSTVKSFSATFTVSAAASVKIKLTETGPSDNGGTFLGAFKLVEDCPVIECSPFTALYEDFSTDANGPTQTGSITNWNILKGNIDVSNTYIVDPSYTGKGIDLAGLENGVIETKNAINLPAGIYTISFLARDNTYGNSAMLLEIGTLFSQTFNATKTVKSYTATFKVSNSTTAKIKLSENGPSDDGGTFLGALKIYKDCPVVTSIFESSQKMEVVQVYPNPSNGLVTIESPSNSKITLISTDGTSQDLEEKGNSQVYQLNLQPGMYFLKISNHVNNLVEVHKIYITE